MEWTDGAMDQLRALWAAGHSSLEIGRRLGCGKNAVIGKAHRLKLAPRTAPVDVSVWTPEMSVSLRRLWDTSLSNRYIAARLGVSSDTVDRHARMDGLPRRTSVKRLVLHKPSRPLPASPETLTFVRPAHAQPPLPIVLRPAITAPASAPTVRPTAPVYARTCQWVTTEGSAVRPWLFCEAPSTRGSYCSVHAARCYAGLRVVADQRVAA